MSKRRGKNRPPKLGDTVKKDPPIIVQPCDWCSTFADKTRLHLVVGLTGQARVCGACHYRWIRQTREHE